MSTHTHTSPPRPSVPVVGCVALFYAFVLPPTISLLDTTWPLPLASQGLGCEMHNQCNIHGLNYVFFKFFFQQILYSMCFFLFVCVNFFLTIYINLFVNM